MHFDPSLFTSSLCLHADGSWEDVNIAEYNPEMDSTAHS